MRRQAVFLTLLLLFYYVELLLLVLKGCGFGPVAARSWGMVTAPLWGPWVLCFILAAAVLARRQLQVARL